MAAPADNIRQYYLMGAVEERWRVQQSEVCARFGTDRVAAALDLNSVVSENIVNGASFKTETWPLHGCRHLATPTTTGWYVWAGEWSDAADYFKPVHTAHLEIWCPDAVRTSASLPVGGS